MYVAGETRPGLPLNKTYFHAINFLNKKPRHLNIKIEKKLEHLCIRKYLVEEATKKITYY